MDGFVTTPGAAEAAVSSPHYSTATQHPDGNREVRAMVMASLPFPPMPMMVSKQLADESSFVDTELKSINSHDLIAHLMNICCCYCKDNDARMLKQIALQEEMFARFDNESVDLLLSSVDKVYELMGEFTRRYIQLYMPDPEKPQDVRFIPWQDVDKDHVVYRKALDFHKAQDLLYGVCAGRPAASSSTWENYGDLVLHSARRIVLSK